MNSFREHNRDLTKSGFYPFTGNGDQIFLPWLMLSLGVTFSGNHHFNILRFQTDFFKVVVCICTITINYTAFRKIKEHILHFVDIIIASRKDCKFYRNTIACRNNLDCKTIKVFSQRGFITPVLLSSNNPGLGDSYILTNSHRETVNNLFRSNVYFLNNFSNIEKKIDNQVINGMYASIELTFTKHFWH